jgi:hypothetical protein
MLKLKESAAYRVGVYHEINRDLAYCGQLVAGPQPA